MTTSVNDKTLTAYEWLRQTPGFLLQYDAVPLTGGSPPFPWDKVAEQISKSIDIKGFRVIATAIKWRTQPEYAEGIHNPETLHFGIVGMDGTFSWLLSKGDLASLASLLLTQGSAPLDTLDPGYLDGIHRFLALETLQAISQSGFDNSLNIQLLDEGTLPEEAALAIDIGIILPDRQLLGRLLISSACRKAWAEHYQQRKSERWGDPAFLGKIPITLGLEVGNVLVTNKEWQSIHQGDFLILDRCSIDPTQPKNRAALTLNGKTLFRVKIKEGTIKILELSTLDKVDKLMERTPHDEEENSEYEEESEEETELSELEDIETSHIEEMESTEKSESTVAPPKEPIQSLSPMDIPLSIAIEVGRLQMSVKKLMELQPGNLLELEIKPENSVDLVVSGKLIATGELLKIGETLGVRILEKQ